MNLKAMWKIIIYSIQNTLLFKGSFLISLFTIFVSELSSICVMIIMLSSFHGFTSYTTGQFLFLYFFTHLSFSITRLLFTNMRVLGFYIQSGFFDKMILMPMNTILFLCCYNFDFSSIFQVITNTFLFILLSDSFGIVWNSSLIIFLIMLLVSSVLVLSSILIILSSMSYYLINWKPLDTLFGAFKETLWYPLTIYNPVTRFIFYTFIPIAFIGVIPTDFMFKLSMAPRKFELLSVVFFILANILIGLSIFIWNKESEKYQSVG